MSVTISTQYVCKMQFLLYEQVNILTYFHYQLWSGQCMYLYQFKNKMALHLYTTTPIKECVLCPNNLVKGSILSHLCWTLYKPVPWLIHILHFWMCLLTQKDTPQDSCHNMCHCIILSVLQKTNDTFYYLFHHS